MVVNRLFCGLVLAFYTAASPAAVISIIIDDLGYDLRLGKAAIQLPGSVTLSVLPETPHAAALSQQAIQHGHELMLHLPMQSISKQGQHETGTLTIDTLESEFKTTVQRYLETLPTVTGVNNHMGSLLTRHPGHMAWLMQSLAEHEGLYFVDSRTTDKTIAATIAGEYAIPHTSRNVFLDNKPNDEAHVRMQLLRLAKLARQQGRALAIGHPHPATIKVLKQMLPRLAAEGYAIVPVSRYIQRQEETKPWRVSSSPSPRVAKN
ncbi:MAG TPA: divergent polysaccharide deacetylase family protein [Chromatiales bacterium]|nr:divergent polysaccharide deacetylase family protein [Thiotrichales bacterium]HIP69660.1 divergent polysaccharide deacetylase family protein [Chromatiales bacterium]